MRRLFSMQVRVAAVSRLWNRSWVVDLAPHVNLALALGRSLERCFSVLVIPDSGRLKSMCCCDTFVTNTIYFGFESQCLTTVSTIFVRCFRGTWTGFSWRMLNQKTIVTALVIAKARGAAMEMFAARHSLSIRSLFHALASISLKWRVPRTDGAYFVATGDSFCS
jgi:hypothetical protein